MKLGELRWSFMHGGMSEESGAFTEYGFTRIFRQSASIFFIHTFHRFIPADWDLTSVVPPNITVDEAASIPIPFMTSVQCLYLRLGLPEPPAKMNGEWILIWSGVRTPSLIS